MDQTQSSGLKRQKIKRRKRTDQQGRNFICPCGKSYLSYPALYTHIKQKHQGNASNFNSNIALKLTEAKVQSQEIIQQQNSIQLLIEILSKYFPTNTNQQSNQQALLNYQTCPKCAENVPFTIRQLPIRQRQYIQSILEYWNEHNYKQQPIQQSGVYGTSISNIFGRLILQMYSKLTARGFKFLVWFIIGCHDSFNQMNNNEKFCDENTGQKLPEIFNQLPIKYFPKFSEQQEFLANKLLVIKVLYHVGKWLYNQRYTNLFIKYNFL